MGRIGFHVPNYDDMKFLSAHVKDLGDNRYQVQSFDQGNDQEDGVEYLVDMTCNICECPVGRDGSVCKHQHKGPYPLRQGLTGKGFYPIVSLSLNLIIHEDELEKMSCSG